MKKGKEILSYHTPTIAAKYIKSYLVIDVVSCVPWEMLLAEGTQVGDRRTRFRLLIIVKL
jgi:hypothetical protein